MNDRQIATVIRAALLRMAKAKEQERIAVLEIVALLEREYQAGRKPVTVSDTDSIAGIAQYE